MAANARAETAEDLAEIVRASPQIQQQLREDPVETIERLAKPLENDPWIYRIVVGGLTLAILGVILASTIIVLTQDQVQIPDVLVALGTGAIGALAGLLAPSPAAR